MKEDFLHYVWKFKKFDVLHAKTTQGESVELIHSGLHNQDQAGPDFFNARLKIGSQLWAGNVEIHLRSSDWYAHQHEKDPAYDNVVLHVVWEHDVEVFRRNNTPIPTLELKNRVAESSFKNYQNLLLAKEKRWINCAPEFYSFSDFQLNNWLERVYIERLEEKSNLAKELLQKTTNDWEAVLFCLLAKNFGLNSNGEAFMQMALSTPFSVVRKIDKRFQMEALLFGQSGMLEDSSIDTPYYLQLKKEYKYLKQKFSLSRKNYTKVNYFRQRPSNFPTIRLFQLASVYAQHKNIFHSLIKEKDLSTNCKRIFQIPTSEFWDTHYTFSKTSKKKAKTISRGFINLIVINTLVPLKFTYYQQIGQLNTEELLQIMKELPSEKNAITKGFNQLRPGISSTAFHSQALIQLKKYYCDKSRCLSCQLGVNLLNRQVE